jgi:para-nitrobenzyl esterase
LQWVQRNAASFGGDATNVTLVGQESGGTAACALIASPLTKGLFSKAILMSGSCDARTITDADKQGVAVVAAAGCGSAPDVAQCMRALPADKVVSALPVAVTAAAPGSPYGVNVDGTFLTGNPIDLIDAGGYLPVTVVLGSTANETSRAVTLPFGAAESDYEAAIAASFPANKGAVLTQYPASDYASPWNAWVALTSDAWHVCPTRAVARAFLDGQDLPVYRYDFAHGSDASADVMFGAWQGVDLLYMFGALGSPSAAESTLATDLQGAFTRFAGNGDPNGGALPAWSVWSDADTVFVFDLTPVTQHGLRNKQCDFWDSLAP